MLVSILLYRVLNACNPHFSELQGKHVNVCIHVQLFEFWHEGTAYV